MRVATTIFAVAASALCLCTVSGSASAMTAPGDATAHVKLNVNWVPPTVLVQQCTANSAVEVIIPVVGFDPLTATDAQLSANNFAPRPDASDVEGMRVWVRYATHARPAALHCPDAGSGNEIYGGAQDAKAGRR